MRNVLLILHILAAGTWFGANMVQLMVNPRIGNAGSTVAAHWLRTTVRLGTRLYSPAAVLILLSGIGLVLVSDGAYEFSDLFVSVGFLVVIVGAALGMAVFAPVGRRAADAYEAGQTQVVQASERRLAMFGMLDTALLIFVITLMVLRLGS
jgi:uncharacterized membrane protein